MRTRQTRQTSRRLLAALPIATMAAAAAVLLRFPPTQYAFYPRCPIHEYLHLECPGCGATRALAALLHGHLQQAWHHNALFVALLPLLIVYTALCLHRAWTSDEFRWPEPPRYTAHAGLALAVIFTLTRNLPL